MKTVIVNFVTQDQAIPGATNAHHFVVALGTMEADVELTARSHTFTEVAPGNYTGFVALVDVNGTELMPPVVYQVVVPADATAPIPVTVNTTIQ